MEQGQNFHQNASKPQINGAQHAQPSSPQQPPKKRIRYTDPPIWAQSVRSKGIALVNRGPMKLNGKQPATSVQPQNIPAPAVRETNGNRQPSPAIIRHIPPEVPHASQLLGPWEESITGKKPFEQMTKVVADFLYMNVVSRDDFGELSSRGIEVEIEAKLGQLINKDTNERYQLPVQSECVLVQDQRVSFRSSMTEVRKSFRLFRVLC
jgi:polynucleotide 5'-triphosphatase